MSCQGRQTQTSQAPELRAAWTWCVQPKSWTAHWRKPIRASRHNQAFISCYLEQVAWKTKDTVLKYNLLIKINLSVNIDGIDRHFIYIYSTCTIHNIISWLNNSFLSSSIVNTIKDCWGLYFVGKRRSLGSFHCDNREWFRVWRTHSYLENLHKPNKYSKTTIWWII